MVAEAIQAAAAACERIELRRLRSPLQVPYKLAFGPIESFDSVLVTVADGPRIGIGEATFLPGYSDETVEAGWTQALDLARQMAGCTLGDAAAVAAASHADAAFTSTALTTACEMLAGHPVLSLARPVSVPLLAVVNAAEPEDVAGEIESHLAAGYRTLKVKVGFDVDADLARLRRIGALVAGRAVLRLDGNQGYDRQDALRFVRALDPEGIELFEQPCAAGDWGAAVAVARASPVPMMLDESIFAIADIERAATLGAARYVKLKLMKAGSLHTLVTSLRRIRSLGMTPVLGNGVATDIGCWMEACVAAREIDNAGEMNGFLKPRTGPFQDPLQVVDGAVELPAGGMPALDPAALDALTVDQREFRA